MGIFREWKIHIDQKETLSQDYFNDGEKTMILTFEEGEVEYDKEMLEKTNSFVINIEK